MGARPGFYIGSLNFDNPLGIPHRPAHARDTPFDLISVGRRLLAELVGTCLLTFVAAFVTSMTFKLPHDVTPIMEALAVGFVVIAISYAFGHISGAHINPIITWALTLRGSFPWRLLPFYWLAQFAGCFIGAGLVYSMLGRGPDTGYLGTAVPFLSTRAAFGLEIVLTFFLVIIELGTATGYKIVGVMSGLAVGLFVAVAGLLGSEASGAVMHPFLALSVAVVGHYVRYDIWIYLVGPPIGSTLAALVMWMISPYVEDGELAHSLGEKNAPIQPSQRLAQPGAMERAASRETIPA